MVKLIKVSRKKLRKIIKALLISEQALEDDEKEIVELIRSEK